MWDRTHDDRRLRHGLRRSGKRQGFKNRFVTLEVHDVTDADVLGNEPLYKDGAMVDRATAGGYGWRLQKSLALGFVRPDLAEVGAGLEVGLLGTVHKAAIVEESSFDPENSRLRA